MAWPRGGREIAWPQPGPVGGGDMAQPHGWYREGTWLGPVQGEGALRGLVPQGRRGCGVAGHQPRLPGGGAIAQLCGRKGA